MIKHGQQWIYVGSCNPFWEYLSQENHHGPRGQTMSNTLMYVWKNPPRKLVLPPFLHKKTIHWIPAKQQVSQRKRNKWSIHVRWGMGKNTSLSTSYLLRWQFSSIGAQGLIFLPCWTTHPFKLSRKDMELHQGLPPYIKTGNPQNVLLFFLFFRHDGYIAPNMLQAKPYVYIPQLCGWNILKSSWIMKHKSPVT